MPTLEFLLSTIVSFFFFIENPSDAVLAEKILAINVGSKSTIFLPDGGSYYERDNNVADHKSTQTFTMVSTLLGS